MASSCPSCTRATTGIGTLPTRSWCRTSASRMCCTIASSTEHSLPPRRCRSSAKRRSRCTSACRCRSCRTVRDASGRGRTHPRTPRLRMSDSCTCRPATPIRGPARTEPQSHWCRKRPRPGSRWHTADRWPRTFPDPRRARCCSSGRCDTSKRTSRPLRCK
jgi:hypothetical protein